ncbi:hypothetical protein [Streptomyces sp. NPDC014746]|uniref:hypothetical protein n=1 Tax=Streptomyces sp. NPDC014746 TaxID=3364904 RepID=UPI0036F7EE39
MRVSPATPADGCLLAPTLMRTTSTLPRLPHIIRFAQSGRSLRQTLTRSSSAGDVVLAGAARAVEEDYRVPRRPLVADGGQAPKYALHGRERLGLLRSVGDALSVQDLHWGDEIRSPAELAPPKTKRQPPGLLPECLDQRVRVAESRSSDRLGWEA